MNIIENSSREIIKHILYSREMVDRYFDETAANWTEFDSELGYILTGCVLRDGMDGAFTFKEYGSDGARKLINYSDRKCRINSYGDSFTDCQQVSDAETWQEYLAAHFGEPIRNYGVGGYGVYQAYRRMLREEESGHGSSHIILNIFEDDHYRSLYAWRWLFTGMGNIYHIANPWCYLRFNPENGRFEERENEYRARDSLYELCDLDSAYDYVIGNIETQVFLLRNGATDVNVEMFKKAAEVLDLECRFDSSESLRESAEQILTECALRASEYIVEKALEHARNSGKRIIFPLSYCDRSVHRACNGLQRFDEGFLKFLHEHEVPFVDSLQKHVDDFQRYSGSPEEYTKEHYIGHYGPKGNHFFAFAIKDTIVEWLDPKPPAYDEKTFGAMADAVAWRF